MAGYVDVARTAISLGGTRVENLTTGTGSTGGAGTGLAFANNGKQMLYINNTGVATPNVVALASGALKGFALNTATQTLATVSGGQYLMGPFDTQLFNDTNGDLLVYFTGGDETDVELVWF
jgi:hypothetical protein